MSNLIILNAKVRQFDNLFCLNDFHRISGNESKHQPTFFVRLDTTQELLAELQQEDPNHTPIKSVNGGKMRGTYAMEEIALAYAMWISPKFHLVVLRAFLAMKEDSLQNSQNTLPAEQATLNPEQQQQIQNAVQATHHRTGMSYAEIYTRIKNKFKVAKYDQLLQSQHRDAMLYIASMQPHGLMQDYVFKLKEADFLVLVLYLNIIKKSARALIELGRFAHSQNEESFSQLAIDSQFELVGKTFKHLQEQILTQAKNCQPHYQQLIMNALA